MKPLLRLLKSAKVLVAVAGIITAIAAEYGFELSTEAVLGILGVVATLIHSIAKEDAAAKSATPAMVKTVTETKEMPNKEVTTVTRTAVPQESSQPLAERIEPMNYYGARQIETGPNKGKFHYTCRNDDRVWAEGPCADGCPGHATAEEACEHYRQGLIAKIEIKGPKTEQWPKNKCAVEGCDLEATHVGMVPGQMIDQELCPAHANAETMATFIKVGERVSSY